MSLNAQCSLAPSYQEATTALAHRVFSRSTLVKRNDAVSFALSAQSPCDADRQLGRRYLGRDLNRRYLVT